jgi:hypothetical protein
MQTAAAIRPPPLPPAQAFADEADRARLTGPAIRAFTGIAGRWQLTNAEAAALLGTSQSTWERAKRGAWRESLSQDQLTRASAVIGIFKALHLLFADAMADRWPGLANRGPLFAGQTPVAAMIAGGIPHLLDIRRYLDAVRGGL